MNFSKMENVTNLQSISYNQEKKFLQILDQLELPHKTKYLDIKDTKDAWTAVKTMQVRGAPAIAIVGCLGVAIELSTAKLSSKEELHTFFAEKMEYITTARPTAVNIHGAAKFLKEYSAKLLEDTSCSLTSMKEKIISQIETMLETDVDDNKRIGKFGAEDIVSRLNGGNAKILTHCNTGELATAGYGTALGVIRHLRELGKLEKVYCTETRPYNQGARLTAYELLQEKIDGTLICDSMVSLLMKMKKIDAVVVGADRVAGNGDTANKIGTYQIAISAKYHNVPFYVAAPFSSIDLSLSNGDSIPIEFRPDDELAYINGIRIAAPGISCWNPSFDVTPAALITGGIITEKGVFKQNTDEYFVFE
ncbi:methylthioribose-1-phosphate isomerase-like isoform X1 [Artemia franciscana]